jgi:hypothetical protein
MCNQAHRSCNALRGQPRVFRESIRSSMHTRIVSALPSRTVILPTFFRPDSGSDAAVCRIDAPEGLHLGVSLGFFGSEAPGSSGRPPTSSFSGSASLRLYATPFGPATHLTSVRRELTLNTGLRQNANELIKRDCSVLLRSDSVDKTDHPFSLTPQTCTDGCQERGIGRAAPESAPGVLSCRASACSDWSGLSLQPSTTLSSRVEVDDYLRRRSCRRRSRSRLSDRALGWDRAPW